LPDTWEPVIYRERAAAWRNKAATLPEDDPNRAPLSGDREGYEKLADQLERRSRLEQHEPYLSPPWHARAVCRPRPRSSPWPLSAQCPAAPLVESASSARHGCTASASRDIMTKSVSALLQLVQRNFRSLTGTRAVGGSVMAPQSAGTRCGACNPPTGRACNASGRGRGWRGTRISWARLRHYCGSGLTCADASRARSNAQCLGRFSSPTPLSMAALACELVLDSVRFAYTYRRKGAAHGTGNPWNRQFSLSLLPRTMRDQADIVPHCPARPSKIWGAFSLTYPTFVMECGRRAASSPRRQEERSDEH
jgi:hypothetical protein